MSEELGEIIGEIGKYIALWFTAGFIVTLFSILFILLSGSFVEKVSELTMVAVIESLPFPIDLLAGWQINPASLVIELLFQVIIFAVLVFLIEGRSRS
jgi:hypothetical protein